MDLRFFLMRVFLLAECREIFEEMRYPVPALCLQKRMQIDSYGMSATLPSSL